MSENLNTVPDGENTATRKTIRLKPMGMRPGVVHDAEPAIKIAPAATAAAPVSSNSAVPAGVADGEDTHTRKTIRLKPLEPKAVSAPVAPAAPVATPAPAAVKPVAGSDSDGEATHTRKTLVLKPISSAKAPASPATMTAKLTPPKPVIPAPAPAPAVKPAPVLSAPKPAAPAVSPAVAEPKEPEKVELKSPAKGTKVDFVPLKFDLDEDKPSMLFAIAGCVAAVAMLYVLVLTGVHYSELLQSIDSIGKNLPSFLLPGR